MRRLLFLALLIYFLIFLSLTTLTGSIIALAIPLVIYLAAGLLFGPEELNLVASRHLSAERVSSGTAVHVKLSITNNGSRLEEALIEDRFPAALEVIEGESRIFTSVERGQTVELAYTIRGRRGLYHFPGVQITASDRLNLFWRQALIEVSNRLFVLPETWQLRKVSIRPRRTRVFSGTIPARLGGAGVTLFGVREYRPGDPMHWINWKASTRSASDTFYTNEFEQERVADVGLVLDVRRRANTQSDAGSIFEHSIEATAALSESFLSDGNRVGLLLYGSHLDWTLPGYGKLQRERILRVLARATPGTSQVFDRLEHLPARFFPSHSQLVVISPLLKDDLKTLVLLRARGYQVLVISPDLVSFERASMNQGRHIDLALRTARIERRLLLSKLQEAGIVVLNWQVDIPFHQAAHAVLSRPALWFRNLDIRL